MVAKGDQTDIENGGREIHAAQGAETRRGVGQVVGVVNVQLDGVLHW